MNRPCVNKPEEEVPATGDSNPKSTKKRAKRGSGGKFTHRKRNRPGGRPYKALQKELRENVDGTEPKEDSGSLVDVDSQNSSATLSIMELQCEARGESEVSKFSSTSMPISEPLETPEETVFLNTTPIPPPVQAESQTIDHETHGDHLRITEKIVPADVYKPENHVVEEVLLELQKCLPRPFMYYNEEDGISILLLSRDADRHVQRRVFFAFDGSALVRVHSKDIPEDISQAILDTSNNPCVILSSATKGKFLERILNVVNRLRQYEVCVGVNKVDFKILWDIDKSGVIDRNPYHELRYSETFRPHTCHLLVDCEKRLKLRCLSCIHVTTTFGLKIVNHLTSEAKSSTRNCYLDRNQLINKLQRQQAQLKYSRAQIKKLKKELQRCMSKDGIDVDEDLSNGLCSAFEGAKLTPIQELFVNQQLKAAKSKGPSGHRWHPTLIRFALLLKTTSSAAYRAMQDSGVITLPSERTLFEYSHATTAESGCTQAKLDRLCKQVLENYPETYQQWHMIEMDEMHINKKLVMLKSTGTVVGYCNLSNAEEELRELLAECTGESKPGLSVASKVLAFMVRGVATAVAEVVASYPTTDSVDSEWLSEKVWEVIGAVEGSGMKVIGVVADGASINRSFFSGHIPITNLESKVVFDTVNLCSKNHERPLYFFSDVPHLLKTLRNNIYHSGSGPRYSRLLTKNGEVLMWQTIRKLYEADKDHNIRRCHKLNSYNVNLDSRSVMKVSYAADVICEATALDLETRNWPNTKELIQLIRHGANFYGMLRGAYSTMGKRKADPNLYPYEREDDERFDKLMNIVKYFRDWEADVRADKKFKRNEQSKMLVTEQTVDGIEMTVRSFISATRYLLKQGVKFVNPKVFNQDPLEKYFGKQRQSGGGSRNPTVAQFNANEIKIAIHKDLNVRGSNVGGKRKPMQITDKPLNKRPRPTD